MNLRPPEPTGDPIWEYLPLVRKVAWALKREHGLPQPIDALVDLGLVGARQALARYDQARGVQFNTFAWPRIKGAILNALTRGGTKEARDLLALTKVTKDLEDFLGRDATQAEQAQAIGWSLERVAAAIRSAAPLVRLDQTVGDDDEDSLMDLIADSHTPLPDDLGEHEQAKTWAERLQAEIAALPDPLEQAVLRGRFGLSGDGAVQTREALSRQLGLTVYRVRALEASGLATLGKRWSTQAAHDDYWALHRDRAAVDLQGHEGAE